MQKRMHDKYPLAGKDMEAKTKDILVLQRKEPQKTAESRKRKQIVKFKKRIIKKHEEQVKVKDKMVTIKTLLLQDEVV